MGFYGDLHHLPLQDILHVLSSHGKSGRLTLSVPSDEITLVFDRGRVASVSASDTNLRIGRLLVEQGYVTEEQVEQALALQAVEVLGYTRLGDVLIELGFVTEKEIWRAVAAQFEASLFRILIQPGGTFAFTAEEPDWTEPVIDEIPIEPIVLNALRMADEWLAVHAANEAIELTDAPIPAGAFDDLEPDDHQVLLALLNGVETKYQLALETGRAGDELDGFLAYLMGLGLITMAHQNDSGDRSEHAEHERRPPSPTLR